MSQSMQRSGRRFVLSASLIVVAVLALCQPAVSSLMPLNWVGSGGGGDAVNWSDPNNWQPAIVPQNLTSLQFTATIGSGFAVTYDANRPIPGAAHLGQSVIDGLTLATGSSLILTSSGTAIPALTIKGPAGIGGLLDVHLGTFTATADGTGFIGNAARVYGSGGATVRLSGTAYSSTGLTADDYYNASTHSWTLFAASDPGTVLDLSAIQTIDAGYAQNGNDANNQHITASGGATINLSGVKTITAPGFVYDYLQFSLSGTSQIDLSSLETISTVGRGYVHFALTGGATVSLPKLTVANNLEFNLSGGSKAYVNGSQPLSYSSVTMTYDDYYSFVVRDWTLFSASDPGTLLDLSAIQTIDAGYGPNGNDYNRQHITASGGATINLSGVKTITAPSSVYDFLQFTASGGEIDLRSVDTISGSLRFDVNAGGRVVVGRLCPPVANTPIPVTLSGSNSSMQVVGNMWLSPNSTLSQGAGTSLSVGRDLWLNGSSSYTGTIGAALEIGRNLVYWYTDETRMGLKGVQVGFNGTGPQVLEVGGLDVGLATQVLANDNFSLGGMDVGVDKPTTVHLMDLLNNGNRGGTAESLYLNYNGVGGQEGLRIGPGSTLILNGINLYAFHNGSLVNINSLFSGTTRIAYDQGLIELTVARADGDFNTDGAVNAADVDLMSLAVMGNSPHTFFDLNHDNTVTQADKDILIRTVLRSQYGDANLDGTIDISDLGILAGNYDRTCMEWACGDYNGDGVVDISDLGILAGHYHESYAGNQSAVPEPCALGFLLVSGFAMTRRWRRR